MHQDDGRGAAPDRLAKAIGQADGGLGLATLVDQRRVDEPAAPIEQHDPELLLRQVGHLRTEVGRDVSGLVERPAVRGWREAIGLTPPGKPGQQPPVFAQGTHQRGEVALA